MLFFSSFVEAGDMISIGAPKGAKKLFLQLDFGGGMIATKDTTPLLRIYGDGTVIVHQKAYMKNAGDYQLKLSEKELEELLGEILKGGLMDFNKQAIVKQKQEILKKRHEEARKKNKPMAISHIADAAVTNLDVTVQFFGGKAKTPGRKKVKKISWYAVKHDMQQFPEIKILKNLDKVTQKLLELTKDKRLKKIK